MNLLKAGRRHQRTMRQTFPRVSRTTPMPSCRRCTQWLTMLTGSVSGSQQKRGLFATEIHISWKRPISWTVTTTQQVSRTWIWLWKKKYLLCHPFLLFVSRCTRHTFHDCFSVSLFRFLLLWADDMTARDWVEYKRDENSDDGKWPLQGHSLVCNTVCACCGLVWIFFKFSLQ